VTQEWTTAKAHLDRVRDILAAGDICDECLGRAFAKLSRGLSNEDRGRALRTTLAMLENRNVPRSNGCWVCGGLFDRIEAWADRAVALVEDTSFDSFLFGVVPPVRVQTMDDLLNERFPGKSAESLKHAFNRCVGRAFERRIPGKTVAFTNPDIHFLIDPEADTIKLSITSLYVYARYRKLERGLPQTQWPCRRCRGRGCPACGGTGKQYPESVEQLIAAPFLRETLGEGAHLHGAGREDIDALMLGTGRPFVLEIVSPRRRTLDLEALRDEVNEEAAGRVEISRVSAASRRDVVLVKETKSTKRYQARVEFSDPVSRDRLGASVEALVGEIEQRTPTRVSHRRADLLRRRNLIEASAQWIDERHALVDVHADGGLYIKELISGDEGRTQPNLSETLGTPARVVELDVMQITSSRFPD